MEQVVISLYNIVGNSFCVSADDGQKVYESIQKALNNKRHVAISFKNVEMVTTAFLNTAIGQLYNGDFEFPLLSSSLSVIDCDASDIESIKRVVETAKLYYSNPERLQESINKVMEG